MRTALGLVCLAVLASCGSSPGSVEELAERIDCKDFRSVLAPRLATEAGTCTSYFDERVTILYFAENSARDEFVTDRTGAGREYLVGDHFVIDGPDRALAEMRLVVDGEFRP